MTHLATLTLHSPQSIFSGKHALVRASSDLWIELRRFPSSTFTETGNEAGTAVAREARAARGRHLLNFILAVVYWLLKSGIICLWDFLILMKKFGCILCRMGDFF